MRICFYARVPDNKLFEQVDFYSNDIKILKELGHEVILAGNKKDIPAQCDLFFIWWWSSGIVPLLKAIGRRKPSITIGNIHYSDKSQQGYHARPLLIKFFINFCLKFSDVQLATSQIEFDELKKYFKPKNLKLLYHCIDGEKYFFSDKPREKIILTVTRLLKLNVERKKVLEILEAFSAVKEKFSDYKLVIVGRKEDDGYQSVFDKINQLNLSDSVELTGSISDEEKINLYHKAKVYVQPTDYEGFGMAIAESMACGTPVVTSKAGAVPEVAGDSALYVNPNSPQEISDAIIQLLEDDTLHSKLSREGAERIKNFFSYEKRKIGIKNIINNL
ncbi:MAG: glycosyltransferase family 4 protein [Bacteroidetes bacterium]|nr:glycosyltransferase family 4 protein [Bacteroidota bacterium]